MNTPKLKQLQNVYEKSTDQEINRLHLRLEDNESVLKFLNQCVSSRGSPRGV